MNIKILKIDSIEEARRYIAETGADPYSVGIMAPKAVFKALMIEKADNRAAAILKQEMLGLGGEAAVSNKVSRFEKGSSPVLLMGTLKMFGSLAKKLSSQPFGLKVLSGEITSVLSMNAGGGSRLKAGRFKLGLGNGPLVMGILNVTPDSFSDGVRYAGPIEAARRGMEMEDEGADIIDIGGESSRPGARPVSEKEEIARVVPVIKKIAGRLKIPVSVDTCKPAVAGAALDAGASIINDITALRYGGIKMTREARKSGAGVILMHMLGSPRTMQKNPVYKDVVSDIIEFFEERAAFAQDNGISRSSLLVDPGIGFGKTVNNNLEILRRLGQFKGLGFPVVVGLSRKSFIGRILGDIPPQERFSGSVAAGIWAAQNGADILRVHDVKETVRALKILRAIKG